MKPIEKILSRLHYHQTRPGQYAARCPAHDDRSPSLGIRETEDGVVVMHCFSGCETSDVLASIGLSFPDLYPNDMPGRSGPPSQETTDRWIVRLGMAKFKAGELNEADNKMMLDAMDRLDRGKYA